MNKRATIIVGASLALLVAGYAIRKLMMDRDFRRRLGWGDDALVDTSSEDSFPASDSPSFTATTSLGSSH